MLFARHSSFADPTTLTELHRYDLFNERREHINLCLASQREIDLRELNLRFRKHIPGDFICKVFEFDEGFPPDEKIAKWAKNLKKAQIKEAGAKYDC